MAAYVFPEGFDWGCATASYQIEGSPLADGAGESIWHRFSHTPDKIMNGDTGDIACDHYRRYKDDVVLMRRLGLNAYRFSTAWPRILPEGRGKVNQAALIFTNRSSMNCSQQKSSRASLFIIGTFHRPCRMPADGPIPTALFGSGIMQRSCLKSSAIV